MLAWSVSFEFWECQLGVSPFVFRIWLLERTATAINGSASSPFWCLGGQSASGRLSEDLGAPEGAPERWMGHQIEEDFGTS